MTDFVADDGNRPLRNTKMQTSCEPPPHVQEIVGKVPKRLHGGAKQKLHGIWMAATKQDAEAAFDMFVAT